MYIELIAACTIRPQQIGLMEFEPVDMSGERALQLAKVLLYASNST